jgi:predicted amidophosphoribosyltransferase
MTKCPNGHIVPAGAKFCPECGVRIAQEFKCPKCGASYTPGQKFCSNCGEKLQ